MKDLQFPEWTEVLNHSGLAFQTKNSIAATVRWYLSFCKRAKSRVNVRTAREFIQWACKFRSNSDAYSGVNSDTRSDLFSDTIPISIRTPIPV